MRRTLRTLATDAEVPVPATIDDPVILDEIRAGLRARGVGRFGPAWATRARARWGTARTQTRSTSSPGSSALEASWRVLGPRFAGLGLRYAGLGLGRRP